MVKRGSGNFLYDDFDFVFKSSSFQGFGCDQSPRMTKDQMVNISHPGTANQRQIRNLYQISEHQPIFQGQFMGMYRGNCQRPFALKPGIVKCSDMIASRFQSQHHSLLGLCHTQFEPTVDGKKMLPYSSKSFYLKNRNNFLKPVLPKLKRSNHKRRSGKGRKLMQKPQGNGFRKIDKLLPKTCMKDLINGERHGKSSLPKTPYHNLVKPYKSDFKMESRKRYAHPPAPLNTSSLIIQGKVGGVSTLVSPYQLSSTSLSTPKLSQSRELLEDTAKDEFGVECYGSMQGLIRFRQEENEKEANDHEHEEGKNNTDGNGLSNGISEERLEIKSRLDQDLSQYEIVNLDYAVGSRSILANRIDDQNSYIGELEDENFALRDKIFLTKRELDDMRRMVQFLEKRQPSVDDVGDEISDCCSDNEMV